MVNENSSNRSPSDLSALRIDRTASVGGGRGGGRGLAVLATIIVLAVAAATLWPRRDQTPEVRVARVVRTGGASAQSGIAANGYVVARKHAALSTDIQGRVVELRVEEGQQVRKGELIARLDSAQLEASMARIRADLARAHAALELARIEEPRARSLVASRVAPQSMLDGALAVLRQAEAQVGSLRAAEREIAVQIEKSSVFAPFDGVIIQKNAEVGEVVSTFGSGGPSSRGAVATLVDFDSLEVQVELAQTSLKGVRTGAPVLIYLDAWPEQAHRGTVRQIWPTADRQKATIELRVTFSERDERVLPEMGARVVFVPEDAQGGAAPRPVEVLALKKSILPGGEPAVLLFTDGQVVRRVIGVGPGNRGESVLVTAGLEGGELVVVDPPASLMSGDRVRLAEEETR